MLRPRITPTLLLRDDGLVKTVKFQDGKYVGDPINAVRIFNEKQVDELLFLDIDATARGNRPNFDLIKKIARECEMPLSYGGGIKTADDAKRIIDLGVEKISVSSAVFDDFDLLDKIANAIGAQSVSVTFDVKKNMWGSYGVYTHNGKKSVSGKLKSIITQVACENVGEVIINNIDRDGMMKGYDHELIKIFRNTIKGPLTVLGGAGTVEDIIDVISQFGVVGVGVGSLFVFNGKYKAVLISYIKQKDREQIARIFEKK